MDPKAFAPEEPKTRFYVDLPDPTATATETQDNAYINVAIFDTREEAEKWLEEVHGMPVQIAEFFISEV